MGNTGVLTLKLPGKLSAKVARMARKRRVSKSEVVRSLIQSAREDAPTFGELAGDLIGSIKGGPRDLSTNPKHMRGFGR